MGLIIDGGIVRDVDVMSDEEIAERDFYRWQLGLNRRDERDDERLED